MDSPESRLDRSIGRVCVPTLNRAPDIHLFVCFLATIIRVGNLHGRIEAR